MVNQHLICLASMLALLFALIGCDGSSPAVSKVAHEGLVIEFAPVCKDGEVWLSSSLLNATAGPIRIENGVVPWDYDPVGTSFEAIASGHALERESGFPLIGRAGPIELAAHERQSGMLPIGHVFPRMKDVLAKQPVTIHWAYWRRHEERNGPDRIEGAIELIRDPCSL